MNLGCRLRVTLAAAIAAAGAGSIALASPVEAGPTELLPDLETLRPLDRPWLQLDVKKNGNATLLLSNRIGNHGNGALELYAGPADEVCTNDGLYDGDDLEADQRIFEDTNANGHFDSGDEVAETPKVGCFEYHPAHGHWHFQDFSHYLLRGKDGTIVGDPSEKIGFCIVDNYPPAFPNLDGVPGGSVYPKHEDGGCGSGAEEPPGTMGLSIGYADTYGLGLPGQELDVSGVGKGKYCLVSTANPTHDPPDANPSQLIESNPDNNARRRLVKLNPGKEKVKTVGSCPAPAELSKLGA